MTSMTIKEIGDKLTIAGRLKIRPLCVYGADKAPDNAVPMTDVDRCVAKAIMSTAVNPNTPPIYIGEGALEGCCAGGLAYFGFREPSPYIKYFVSTGSRRFMNGAAEFLRASPELVDRNRRAVGKIAPLGKNIIVRACADLDWEDPGVRSFLCFGAGEQIRNMCALVHFRSEDPFHSVIVPQGAACASFVTYATGMAANGPGDAVVIGPCDPTGNSWFPADQLSIAIPIEVARRMADDIDSSFITKRTQVAYPRRRTRLEKGRKRR